MKQDELTRDLPIFLIALLVPEVILYYVVGGVVLGVVGSKILGVKR